MEGGGLRAIGKGREGIRIRKVYLEVSQYCVIIAAICQDYTNTGKWTSCRIMQLR